ncbi:hypothetical protein Tco_0818847 [Tanacetum coccineum]
MELYIQSKDNGQIILNSVENGPLIWPTVALENGTVRPKTYEELSDKEKLQADYDLKATNIQERDCKLYDEFDKLSYVKGERLHQYYLRFAQLINDMNIIQMTMQPVQMNTKFLNSLLPEWGNFVTDVKLARDFHTSNYDQLYAYREQHKVHANETRLMRERFPNTLAFVANYHQQPSYFNNYHSQHNTPQYHNSLAVLTFLPGDELIACMNKGMAFLSAVFTPCYPSTNNQLRSSSNPRNQATIQDGRVTIQQVQGRQGQNVVDSGKGHMARQCTQPKRRRDATWFKEKVLLVQAQAEGKELDEEQLAFLADPGVADG